MKRLAVPACLLVALCLPAAAHATVQELGQTPGGMPAASCPENCTAIGKVTGFQVSNGTKSHPFRIHRVGKIVAFTVKLGKPNTDQITFFQRLFGSPAHIRLAVLRPPKNKKIKGYILKRQSAVFVLDHYFGSSPTFALPAPLLVGVKDEIAVTTDTWAPILSVSRPKAEAWRSSRAPNQCDNVQAPATHDQLKTRKSYSCLHSTARLLYTVTFIPDPKRTDGKK
jgi:hypothetical protein